MFLDILFYSFSALALVGTLGTLFCRKTLHNILSLVLVFLAVAGCFMLAHAPFLGMILVILYVGAVIIFFLFAVMMFGNETQSTALADARCFGKLTILPLCVGGFLFYTFGSGLGTEGVVLPVPHLSAAAVGEALYLDYATPLFFVGLILLAAIIGGVALTSQHRKDVKRQQAFHQVIVEGRRRIAYVSPPFRKGVQDV